jgi:hypothetical protein
MPEEQVDAMLASTPPLPSRPAIARPAPGVAEPAPRPGRHPVVTLLQEVERRKSITHVRVQKGDDIVEWRRAP